MTIDGTLGRVFCALLPLLSTPPSLILCMLPFQLVGSEMVTEIPSLIFLFISVDLRKMHVFFFHLYISEVCKPFSEAPSRFLLISQGCIMCPTSLGPVSIIPNKVVMTASVIADKMDIRKFSKNVVYRNTFSNSVRRMNFKSKGLPLLLIIL